LRSLFLSSTLTVVVCTGAAAAALAASAPDMAAVGMTEAGLPKRVAPATSAAAMVPGIPPITPSTSLLVVSPHPDDETLCCAGVIQRVVHEGGRVSVVWITSGDASELDLLVIERSVFVNPQKMRDLGGRRMQEARNAAAILGVPPDRQFFLGYPDRGVLALLTDNYVTPYLSRFTHAASVPYRATMSAGHPYTGQSLEHDFGAVLDRVRPTLILAPSPRDLHPDHRATGVLTLRVLSQRNELPAARYWIVHGGEGWPRPRGFEPALPLTPGPADAGLSPTPFALGESEEQRKLLALRSYRTQMTITSTNLLSFVRTNELFSSDPVPRSGPPD
jgi:LmbE family N-acetylglucosaminyl deacetylase